MESLCGSSPSPYPLRGLETFSQFSGFQLLEPRDRTVITPELKENARRFVQEALRPYDKRATEGLQHDDLWERLTESIQQVHQGFQKHFSGIAELKREFLFINILNDLLLADKNFIPCPIW